MITPREPEHGPGGDSAATLEPAPDAVLLRRYAREHDEGAFRQLVERHIDLVHSLALRRLGGDAHAAADVTQQVFTALARGALRLAPEIVLAGWLYGTTRHLSANWVRAEQSRRARERTAQDLLAMNTAPAAVVEWDQVRPWLDTVLDELGERDRTAILLRFFARHTFAQVGGALQVSEDAARMRVERALERLRAALAKRGVLSSAAALGGLLAQNAVAGAPAGLAATVAAGALKGAGVAVGIFALMNWTKLLIGVSGVVVVAGTVATVAVQRDRAAEAPLAAAPLPVAAGSRVDAAPVVAAPTEPNAGALALQRAASTSKVSTAGHVYPQINLAEVLAPNNVYYDGVTGVTMTYPEGWRVHQAMRWGDRNRENTVHFATGTRVQASMYYNMYADGAPPPVSSEQFFRTSAEKKEIQRVQAGRTDYKNVPESFVFREIDGRPSMSYFATYTQGDEVKAEYFMRIAGQRGYVMFFVNGSFEALKAQIPTIHQMGTTVRVP